ncbi:MAG: N-acetylmuramoyl-L-alanine amidase [Blastocatellia bacterium]|jgi:hypothetical protein|nr:N-acetylmuramoyl-L-alanine amidase [Blastocatellia bacterium]
MFGSDILDIAIGLVFVYLLLSLICSVLNEWIAAIFSMRATNLEDGIRTLLTGSPDKPDDDKQDIAHDVYDHALISGLFKVDWLDRLLKRPGRPSYIPSRTFALALLDIVAPSDMGTPQTIDDVRQAIDNLPEGHTKEALLTLVNNAQGDLQRLRRNIENWFNDSMDRVSGWYKRKSQVIILVLALLVAVVSNADSVAIVNTFFHNPALRASAVTAAQEYVKNNPSNAPNANATQPLDRIRDVESKLEPLHMPLGWVARPADRPEDRSDPRYFPNSLWALAIKLFGLLLTAIAISLGAPFWFDVLNKFIVIRSTVKPREKSLDESSKDNTSEVQAAQNLVTADANASASSGAGTGTDLSLPGITMEASLTTPMLAPAPAPVLIGEAARRGAELVNLANQHVGETYILGSLVPMNNTNWHGPWDCAEFVSWCVYQLIGKLYGCRSNSDDPAHTDAYTGWWGRDAKTVVKRITIREATNSPGALLLRLPQPHMNGHIVISDGTGGTVEAHSHARGVINDVVAGRRWDMGILIPELQYTGAGDISVMPPSGIYRLASPYMSGPEVLRIQQQLKAHGVDPGELDGKYGPQTSAAVYSFQAREGLLADGEVGPQTTAALASDAQEVTTFQSYPGLDMGDYPGDEVMREVFGKPYVFTGYYLNSPCHRDRPTGHWTPWMGHQQTLKEIGWGLVVVYVGQQVVGASPCHQNNLTRSQGERDGNDAIEKAMSDHLRNDVTIFLDVEAVDVMPGEMLEYVRAWFGRLLDDGHYKPGIYCHGKNAGVLFNVARQVYSAHGLSSQTPPFWVVRLKDGFDLHRSVPAESGVPYAVVWQGKINIGSETHGHVTIESLDHNVATTDNPSNA